MSKVSISEEAIEKAAIRQAGMFAGDEGQWRGYWEFAKAGLEAAAPLIVAAREDQVLADAIELLNNLGKSVMHAAREAVNGVYHSVHEGAVDLAAVTALDVARRALIDARRESASVLRGEG